MRREAKFQTKFNQFVRERKLGGCFELKQTTTASLPFRAVKDHQITALLAVKHNVLAYKLPDDTRSFRPFDSFCVAGYPAYVAIQYPGAFYLIDIDAFVSERDTSSRRSLTESRAAEICAIKNTP